ncbi:codanin-1 isoform X2 [Microplitis demolitor]|uniref:codanin-1 isoform X2 n=1 Tax=Microplitis demolitor TaxID=69319 RepID=UPI00235B62B5|nr:codanin-1 isoform X2 [Microplitis demolitor]
MMDILNKIIKSEISIDEILEWLTANNYDDINFPNIAHTDSSPTEFISYFLDYLRKQCHGILYVGNNDASEGQVKKTVCCTPSKQKELVDKNKHQIVDENKSSKLQLSTEFNVDKSNSSERNFIDTNTETESCEIKLTSTPLKKILHMKTQADGSITPGIIDLSKNMSTVDSGSSFNELSKSFSPIVNRSYPQSSNLNRSVNIDDALNGDQSISSTSLQVRQSMIDESIDSNASLNTSMIPCSPISPLYTSYMSPKCNILNDIPSKKRPPRNRNKNKSPIYKQNNNQIINDNSHSICFGDFLSTEVNNLKKNNKKDKTKNQNFKLGTASNSESSKNELSTQVSQSQLKTKRRIKPTKLDLSSDTINKVQVFGIVNRPRIVNPQFVETQPNDKLNEMSSFEIERGLLKLERQKQPKIDVITEVTSQELKCVIKPKSSSFVVPKLELVENIKVLDILAKLYSCLLSKNLILNPMSELYFIISLITFQYKLPEDEDKSLITVENKQNNNLSSLDELKINLGVSDVVEDSSEISDDNNKAQLNKKDDFESVLDESTDSKKIELSQNEKNYFSTAHNCIYFATAVLFNGKNLLSVLDRATLKLLYDNALIVTFQPTLREYLKELYSVKCIRSKQYKPYNDAGILQTNVCFQMDTDNRENFPSPLAFSTFRKQRDLFYEILKTWEENHLRPNWSFSTTLDKKINTLLSMHHDAINYYHIARLFKSQLLMSSVQIGQSEQLDDDQNLSVFKYLKDMDPEKLKQLKERLVTPVTSLGPVPQPEFLGIQEFYRDFILASSNPKFNVILEHCFIQEIMELNETQFTCSDIDTKENSIDEITKQNYIICLSSLRVMAKFLGFLVSLPFKSEVKTLDSINTQIALRSRTLPPLDLQECLSNAIKNGKLLLTVPWLVQYLAMMDSVSFYLPYYLKLCEILYYIYRTAYNLLNLETALLITFSVGWLFELPNFPKDLYYNWHSHYNSLKIKVKHLRTEKESTKTSSKLSVETSKNITGRNIILDEMKIIDDRALYICCKFLKELKILLKSGNSSINSGSNANRHITPVSCKLPQPSNSTKSVTLELQLENAFFHSQPRSIKKTVDFVSERVASTCVKYICAFVISTIKEKNYKIWKKKINKKTNEEVVATVEMDEHKKILTCEIKDECKKIIPKMCEAKIKNSIESLLAEDILESVKNMCIKIAVKMSMERINQWIDSYINGVMISKNIYEDFLNKKLADGDEDSKNIRQNIKIDFKEPYATSVINDIRNSMWELIEQNGKWSILIKDNILINIRNIRSTLFEKNGLIPSTKKVLCTLSIDYALHIMVFKSELMTINVEDNFIELWKLYSNADELFSGLLSPRNIRLLMQTYDSSIWTRYGKFIQRLLAANILTIESFSEQCVAFLRLEWHVHVLKSIPSCLLQAISHYNCSNEHTEKVKYLIGWIAETCPELNYN